MVSRPLIEPDALAAALGGSGGEAPVVLDVRWELGGPDGREQYDAGHIPGAAFADLERELSAPPGLGGRHPLPEPASFAAAMRAKGVSAGRPVVVYDAAGAQAAARAWWLLRYFGHPGVRVLDGGLAAWRAAGYPLAHGEPRPAAGDFEARPGGMVVLDAGAAARTAAAGVLLDARAPERFVGRSEPVDPVAGHIPGARNHPAGENLDARGRFLDAEELRDRFARSGVGEGVEVAAYCGSGVTAAQLVLALELAGYPAGLYAGSWSEWIPDPARPVATGTAPHGVPPG